MRKVFIIIIAVLCVASASAIELQAWFMVPGCRLSLPDRVCSECGCVGKLCRSCGGTWATCNWEPAWLKVDPTYQPPASGTDFCIVAAVPEGAERLIWRATELWELPPQVSDAEAIRLAGSVEEYKGWTRLSCGAVRGSGGWSFSCFDSGQLGIGGRHTGTAAQLDQVVRAWWGSRR